jgi:hypothetical protein
MGAVHESGQDHLGFQLCGWDSRRDQLTDLHLCWGPSGPATLAHPLQCGVKLAVPFWAPGATSS